MVWADVRHFLKNPGEVLERIKEQTTADEEAGALEQRRADLRKRLQGTHAEYDRYMKLYGKGEFDQARLKELLRDVEVRAEQLRMLLSSVEAQLSERLQQRQVAETTAAWLATLRDRVSEVEGNTEEAFSARNDAKNELGSDRDGHRKVGEGCIPVDAWPGFFDGLPGVPVVMETPYGTHEADSEEVLLVKKLAGGLRKAPVGR